MLFMTLLKVVFSILICVPIIYFMIYLLTKLIDEVLKQNPKKGRSTKKTQNRSRYK